MHMQCMTKAYLVRRSGSKQIKSRVMECILHSQEQAVIGRVCGESQVEEQLGCVDHRQGCGCGGEGGSKGRQALWLVACRLR